MLLMVDEAHQFLDRSVGEDANRFRLESFGLIAKEGRTAMPDPALKSMASLSCTRQPAARRRSSMRSRAISSGVWFTSWGMP